MILVESLWDREAFAWQADWYRGLVCRHLGAAADDRFRVWFTDHALHGDSAEQEDPTRTVSYLGVLQQALRDLSAWVERGGTQVHLLFVDAPEALPAGHVAVVVEDYPFTLDRLRAEGHVVEPRREHWGSPRAYVRDPAGNLVELMAFPRNRS